MTTSTPLFHRLLLTGAAGSLGRVLRPRLKMRCEVLRVSDIADLGSAAAGEELQPAPLQDKAAVMALLQGVQAVVHLGGVSTEHSFEEVLPANIVGTYHVYEAARVHGVRCIVFASSNHVTGFYTQGQTITPAQPKRPDGYYGLSKAFGEDQYPAACAEASQSARLPSSVTSGPRLGTRYQTLPSLVPT